MMYGFAIQVILVLILLSGLIAFVGNRIGRFFGKRRLSLFNLRPRHTATIFTIGSGILITLLTFTTLFFMSRDVRIALFGLDNLKLSIQQNREELDKTKSELQKQINELNALKKNLEVVQQEKYELELLRNNLKQEIDIQKSKEVIFNANQPIFIDLIEGGRNALVEENEVKDILSKIDQDVKKYKVKDIEVSKQDFDSAISYLSSTQGNIVLRIISSKNVVVGENLPVKFSVSKNKLIYKKGDEILRTVISGKLSQAAIEQKLKNLISSARMDASNKGVLPNVSGALGSVSYSDIFNVATKIKAANSLANV